jgi:iron(III) transport system substrate-binding protein
MHPLFAFRHAVTAAAALGLGSTLTAVPAAAQQNQFGPPALIEAARKEGTLVYYTANFIEVEQEVVKAFNKRFPFIKVEIVRAPGGQLITRVKTEAAAGKLAADVVDHSDPALMTELTDLFQDYTPPNAADYIPDVLISPKLWPRVTLVWSIAYNSALVKNPPKTWGDLTKPEYGNKQIGQVFILSGGTTWTRAMFERQVLGEDYWRKQAATTQCFIPPARRPPTRWCAAKSRSRRSSTTSSIRRRRTARRSKSSSRRKARRSIPMPRACRRPPPIRMPRSSSSTGACRRKARLS